ncbi:MAG: twin-arginine translocation signal domain-containing protein [Acidobacteriota bacterium]
MTNISRRDLLKTTLAATITASLAGPVTGLPDDLDPGDIQYKW